MEVYCNLVSIYLSLDEAIAQAIPEGQMNGRSESMCVQQPHITNLKDGNGPPSNDSLLQITSNILPQTQTGSSKYLSAAIDEQFSF